jgi:hypothetical protein
LVKKNAKYQLTKQQLKNQALKKTEIEVMFFSPGLMETMRAAFNQHQKKKDEGK